MSPTAGRTIVILALLALAGCRAADPVVYPRRRGQAAADVIVLDNHWHTALIFATADLPPAFRQQLGAEAEARYVAIGWGDEGFFRAVHITPRLVAQALLFSRGSVLLVIGFDAEPEAAFLPGVDIWRIPSSRPGLDRTIASTLATFRRDAAGQPIDAGPGISDGRFFAAVGRYAFYHTCNQWTADRLAAGGLPITGAYAGTAIGLETQLQSLPGVRRNGLRVFARRPTADVALRLNRGSHP